MKIFDGFEEFEIVPWFECKDCAKHSRFPCQLSALFFLQRFRTYDLAIDSLRRLIRERGGGLSPAILHDEEVLDQTAQMLVTGELHVTRKPLDLGGGATRSSQGGPRPRPQPAPQPVAGPSPQAPPPEEPVFLPNVDPVAMAQVLTQAAQSGKPFCEH